MIRNNELTYAAASTPWYSFDLPGVTLNALAVATIATLLSFQAAALLFDLLLGCKPRGVAKVSTLHTLLLVRKSSPLAIAAALFRNDWLTRLYYRRQIPSNVKIARHEERIKPRVILLLFVLLAVAPLTNIASIILTLSTGRDLSFSEAGFDGVAFGVDKSLAVANSVLIEENCMQMPVRTSFYDVSVSDFTICKTPPFLNINDLKPNYAGIVMGLHKHSQIIPLVMIDGYHVHHVMAATTIGDERLHFVDVQLQEEALDKLYEYGLSLVQDVCNVTGNNFVHESLLADDPSSDVKFLPARFFPCVVPGDTTDIALQVLTNITEKIGLIPSDEFRIALYNESALLGPEPILPFFNGGNVNFLKRRRRYIGLSGLSVIAGVTVVMRLLAAALVNNDVRVGLGSAIGCRLGSEYPGPMLESEEQVLYGGKYQQGLVGHYGLPRDMLGTVYRVERFEKGVIGGEFEGDSSCDLSNGRLANPSRV